MKPTTSSGNACENREFEAGLNSSSFQAIRTLQQLIVAGVWLLNPGPEVGRRVSNNKWVSVENWQRPIGRSPIRASSITRAGRDTSDNVPGVKGHRRKNSAGTRCFIRLLESISSTASELTKKRPREAMLAQADMAVLSKEPPSRFP